MPIGATASDHVSISMFRKRASIHVPVEPPSVGILCLGSARSAKCPGLRARQASPWRMAKRAGTQTEASTNVATAVGDASAHWAQAA